MKRVNRSISNLVLTGTLGLATLGACAVDQGSESQEPRPSAAKPVEGLPIEVPLAESQPARGDQPSTATGAATGAAMGEATGSDPGGAVTPGETGSGAAAAQPAGDDPDLAIVTITSVDVDTRLAAMCNIADSKLYFKYDAAKLSPEATQLLADLATCVKTGPAKGKDLAVIGRTDPRGSDAYNKELGMSRAESVARFLRDQGVNKTRVDTLSEGEADASKNPSSWPYDRRVTVRLAD